MFAVQATTTSGIAAIHLLAIDDAFRIRYKLITGRAGLSGPWHYETTGAVVATTPSMTSSRRLYVKGLGDGAVYTKTLDASTGYAFVPGL